MPIKSELQIDELLPHTVEPALKIVVNPVAHSIEKPRQTVALENTLTQPIPQQPDKPQPLDQNREESVADETERVTSPAPMIKPWYESGADTKTQAASYEQDAVQATTAPVQIAETTATRIVAAAMPTQEVETDTALLSHQAEHIDLEAASEGTITIELPYETITDDMPIASVPSSAESAPNLTLDETFMLYLGEYIQQAAETTNDPAFAQEITALLTLIQETRLLPVDPQFILETACRRLLQCLGEDTSDEAVAQFISLLMPEPIDSQMDIPETTSPPTDIVIRERYFTVSDLVGQFANSPLRALLEILGKLAVQPQKLRISPY